MKKKVLLTGVSGFLGSHTAIQLLNKGYQVTGTLRDLARATELKAIIAQHTDYIDQLSFAKADLSDHTIWDELTRGMDYIQHVASPFPQHTPKNDDEVVLPAKKGILSILQAATKNRVKRVVLTSSSSAVLHGKPKGQENGTFNEEVWADENRMEDTTPYYRSKIIAEKTAWAYNKDHQDGPELVTVLPGALLGPALEQDFGNTPMIILKMLDGSLPAVPKLAFDLADVRSVADLLILAMENEDAAGERFLGSSGFMTMKEITEVLRKQYPGKKIPSAMLPVWLTHVLSWFDKPLQQVLLDLGKDRRVDNSKARMLLGWKPINKEEAVLSCAESLINLGLVK